MSEEERSPFIEEAERLRILHQKEYPDYKYRPKKRQRSGGEETTTANNNNKEKKVAVVERKRFKVKQEEGSAYQVPSPLGGPLSPPSLAYATPLHLGVPSPASSSSYKEEWTSSNVPASPTFPFSPNNVSGPFSY